MQFLIVTIVAVSIGFAGPSEVDRPKYAKAVANYTREPNKENEAELKLEKATNRHAMWTTREEVAGLLIIVMNVGWFSLRQIRVQLRKRMLQ